MLRNVFCLLPYFMCRELGKATHISGYFIKIEVAMLEEVISNDGAEQGELRVIPGFRFYPTEEELVGFYLRQMVQGGHTLSFDIVIPTLDLYRYDPWELPGFSHDARDKQWFFFVPRDRKKSCPRLNRLTVSGYWKATGSDRGVRNELLQCIGLKKILVFYKGKGPYGHKTDWIMNEYRMPEFSSSAHKMKDIVLCRIYRKVASHKLLDERAKANPNPIEKGPVVWVDEYQEKPQEKPPSKFLNYCIIREMEEYGSDHVISDH